MSIRPVALLIRKQVLLTLPPQAIIQVACQHMRERYVDSVLETDERSHLAGIFTKRDAVCRVLAQVRDTVQTRLAQMMTNEVDTVAPRVTALEARRVVGIVSYTDFGGIEHARLEEETELFETIR